MSIHSHPIGKYLGLPLGVCAFEGEMFEFPPNARKCRQLQAALQPLP
jgi:hypothetical protein